MLCSASAFLEALLLRVPADVLRAPILSEGSYNAAMCYADGGRADVNNHAGKHSGVSTDATAIYRLMAV